MRGNFLFETSLFSSLLFVLSVSSLSLGGTIRSNNDVNKNIRRLQDYPDDGLWPQRGNDISSDNPLGIFELNSLAMNNEGTRVVVGEGRIGTVSIYDYDRESELWKENSKLFLGGRFGKTTAISSDGNRLVVGKYDENDFTGVTKIFEYSSNRWDQVGQDLEGDDIGDWSGYSVSISGDGQRVAIGIPFRDPNMSFSSGIVRTYQWDAGSSIWRQIGRDIVGEASGDRSGIVVAMAEDGKSVAVAASFNDGTDENGAPLRNSGQVRVYTCSTILEWRQQGSDIDGPFDYSGNPLDVAISSNGDHVIVGYPTSNNNKGGIVVYRSSVSREWEVHGNILEGDAEDDQFGYSVSMALNGAAIMVGVPGAAETDRSGVSFIYEYVQPLNLWEPVSVDTSTACFKTTMSSNGQVVATMSPSTTKVFKYELDTEFPSMTPTISSQPSLAPTVSFEPTEVPQPFLNILQVLIPLASILMIFFVGITILPCLFWKFCW